MMKFATIMREAGICPRLFPECGEINVVLYDEDDNVTKENDVRFVQNLFVDNKDSFDKFFDFVDSLNSDPDYLSMDVKITPDHVIVFCKSPNAKIFRRTTPLDPLDFAD